MGVISQHILKVIWGQSNRDVTPGNSAKIIIGDYTIFGIITVTVGRNLRCGIHNNVIFLFLFAWVIHPIPFGNLLQLSQPRLDE